MKESEAKLLSEIKEFERQEDETLQHMEETMRMMSSPAPPPPPPPAASGTTPSLNQASFHEVTLKQILEDDDESEADLFDFDHLEQQILDQGDQKEPNYVSQVRFSYFLPGMTI